jgi:hypothetical protein
LTETGFALAKRIKKKDPGLDPSARVGFQRKGVLEDSGSESDLKIAQSVFAVPRAVGVKNRPAASASGVYYSGRPDASSFGASSSTKPVSSSSYTSKSPLGAVFGYEYIDPDGNQCKQKEKAFVEVQTEGVVYKITFHQSQFCHAKAARVLKAGIPGSDGRSTGYLSEADADDIAPGIFVATPRKEAAKELFVKTVVTPKYVVPELPCSDYKPIVCLFG